MTHETAAAALDGFEQPQQIDALTRAFPAHVVGILIPDEATIPAEFGLWGPSPWVLWASSWFAGGWPESPPVWPREGVDPDAAAVHLRTVLASWQPRHEHKIAAVAWLGSRWYQMADHEGDGDVRPRESPRRTDSSRPVDGRRPPEVRSDDPRRPGGVRAA